MKFTAWYSIIVGALMLAQWAFFLAAGQVPELQTAPYSIAFHLVAEFTTALALIASGAGLLKDRPWSKTAACVSLGMLVYTTIVSPGYFAQQGAWPLVAMFAVLLLLALFSIRQLFQTRAG